MFFRIISLKKLHAMTNPDHREVRRRQINIIIFIADNKDDNYNAFYERPTIFDGLYFCFLFFLFFKSKDRIFHVDELV